MILATRPIASIRDAFRVMPFFGRLFSALAAEPAPCWTDYLREMRRRDY